MKESTLQQQCVDYLTLIASRGKPIFFFAPMNETAMMLLRIFKVDGKKISKIISFLKKMGMVPGTPDLQICYCGTSIFIELKKPGKKPTRNQLLVHEKIKSTGHRVEVVTTFEEFQQVLKFCGVVE